MDSREAFEARQIEEAISLLAIEHKKVEL